MIKRFKTWLAVSGIILVVLGTLCISSPSITIKAIAWIIAVSTLLIGLAKSVFAFQTQRFLTGSASRLFSAIIDIVIGVVFLMNLSKLGDALPIIFAIWVIIQGLIVVIDSFDYRRHESKGWWAVLVVGIIVVLLGVTGIIKPDASARVLTLIIGLAILFKGVSYLLTLIGIGKLSKEIKQLQEAIDRAALENQD